MNVMREPHEDDRCVAEVSGPISILTLSTVIISWSIFRLRNFTRDGRYPSMQVDILIEDKSSISARLPPFATRACFSLDISFA